MQLSGIVKRRVDNTLHTLHILQQDVHWGWAGVWVRGWYDDLQMLFAVCIRSQMHSTLR